MSIKGLSNSHNLIRGCCINQNRAIRHHINGVTTNKLYICPTIRVIIPCFMDIIVSLKIEIKLIYFIIPSPILIWIISPVLPITRSPRYFVT